MTSRIPHPTLLPTMPEKKKKSTPKETKEKEASDEIIKENIKKYLPYLKDIRKKLFNVFVVFFIGSIIGFTQYQKILGRIMGMFDLQGVNIVLTSPYQFISLAVNTGIVLGAVLAIPLFIYYLLSFLKPALRPREYNLITQLIPASLLLFILGFALGVWIVQFVISLYTRTTLEFSIGNLWDISGFFGQILLTGFLLALIFQLPIIMTALLKLKIVPYSVFKKQRSFFYALILIIGALLPPTDILSLMLLTIPPLFLFELALLLNKPQGKAVVEEE